MGPCVFQAGVQYHSSAVLAVALDTLSVPYRMSSSGLSMLHLAEALTFGGRKVGLGSWWVLGLGGCWVLVPFPALGVMSLSFLRCCQPPVQCHSR